MSAFYESSKTRNAKEEDRFLQKNYGYSLWHFSLSLAISFSPLSWKDYREGGQIKILKKMNNKLQKISEQLAKPPFPYATQEDINNANKEIDWILNSQNTRGAPSKRINIIALAWSCSIDSPIEIIELLAWFKERFKNTIGYKPICDGVDKISKESLRKSLHRHKTKSSHKVWIEECRDIFKAIPGAIAISFEDKRVETRWIEKSNWHKDTPLITFPTGEILTVRDFEGNIRKAKTLDKNRVYPNL